LRALRDLTRRCDTLLIADEVATGFCRTGAMFACHHERVTPDLMCLAKGISGGYLPLAATLTTEEIFEAFLGEPDRPATFFHGHTYTGNALACAAAIASFDLIGANGVLDAAGAKIDRIAAALAEMEAIPQVARTRQRGFMVGVDLARPDGEPFDPAARTGAAVCRAIRDCGVIIRPLGDTLVLMPAPGIDPDSLERLLAGVAEGLTRRFGSA
jgi:adenosylmethionine-8-amino-7-oxononanoate aminotransferase